MKDGDGAATFSGKGFSRALRQAGRRCITEYRYKGATPCWSAVRAPDFWRAPTNNDRGAWKVIRGRGPRQTRR